ALSVHAAPRPARLPRRAVPECIEGQECVWPCLVLVVLHLTHCLNSAAFSEDEDRFLICSMHEAGWGQWEEIKRRLRSAWQFRFGESALQCVQGWAERVLRCHADWFFKSRSAEDLKRRGEYLVKLLEKEEENKP